MDAQTVLLRSAMDEREGLGVHPPSRGAASGTMVFQVPAAGL